MSRERQYCQRCGEMYLLENLEDCHVCDNWICYRCGSMRESPEGNKVYICSLCLEYADGWWKISRPPKELNEA
jgi:hypothetical protein